MTKPKPLPEIEKCACGRAAILTLNLKINVFWSRVACAKSGMAYMDNNHCWEGPSAKTERAAIEAWNRIMQAAKRGLKDG